jgi:hypothetical protein
MRSLPGTNGSSGSYKQGLLPYYVSCYAIYNGALIAGDSISENVYELLSGFNDNGTTINNYWEGPLDDLDIEELKREKKFRVQGEISRDQTLEIYASFDRSAFVLLRNTVQTTT